MTGVRNRKEMHMYIRKAEEADIPFISDIYERIHSDEESGKVTIGWVRGIYPTRATAESALQRGDLFVGADGEKIVASAVINQVQMDSYAMGNWSEETPEKEIMVLHTLVIDPDCTRRGFGREFVRFYEEYAEKNACTMLRMDTQDINVNARKLYQKLGYTEVDTVPCSFNGIADIRLVLLEKKIK